MRAYTHAHTFYTTHTSGSSTHTHMQTRMYVHARTHTSTGRHACTDDVYALTRAHTHTHIHTHARARVTRVFSSSSEVTFSSSPTPIVSGWWVQCLVLRVTVSLTPLLPHPYPTHTVSGWWVRCLAGHSGTAQHRSPCATGVRTLKNPREREKVVTWHSSVEPPRHQR